MNTRTGKIARLPKEIREQLNRRLENGHTARTILPWLNALPETKQILTEQFESKPIRAQNLSEWKKGGYQDWLQQQERIDWFDHFCENEVELAKHENCGDTFEAMSRIFIVEIGQSIAALRNIKDPRERSHCLQNLAREFSRLQNAFNFSRKTQLAFDKHNGLPAAQPDPIEDIDEPTEESEAHELAPLGAPASRRHGDTTVAPEGHEPEDHDEPQPQGAPASCRLNAPTSPEPHVEPEASSPSPPQKGGLELLGKQRKESAESGGPPRAERAGASESLGRGENSPRPVARIEPPNLEKPTTSVSLAPIGGE